MIEALIIITILSLTIFFYMRQEKFGKAPSKERQALLQKSPNYKKGKFENIHYTPNLTEGYNIGQVLYEFLFKKSPRRMPVDDIPSVKTDLINIPINENVLVWFGHSSYYIQVDGRRILMDPVLSGNASPIPGTNKSFKGSDIYSVADFPSIDYLFISHDHYDHVDYETIKALKNKINKVICGLGVGEHFEYWGYKKENIIEKDWHEKIELDNGFIVNTAPARHFSGRSFSRNNTLWLSYVLQTPSTKIYLGGDSGYDTHFADIGNKYGPFDLAILENGQYDIKWRYIHMLPEEVLKASQDLKAKRLLPLHSAKFMLANHAWDEPLAKITELNKSYNIPLITPMIGEVVDLKDNKQSFKRWWEGLN